MRFNTKSLCEMSVPAVEKQLLEIKEPAVLLDTDLKIIAKNISANEYFAGIRRGTKFNRFISEKDIFTLAEMPPESVFNTTLVIDGAKYVAMVISGNGFYLAVVRRLYAKMFESVVSAYGRMSGYDAEIVAPAPERSEFYRNELADLLFGLLNTMDFLNGLPFFNASLVLRGIADEIGKLPNRISNRFEFVLPQGELITNGSDCAFALVALFSAVFMAKDNNKVKIELLEINGEILLRVCGQTLGSVYDMARIASLPGRLESNASAVSEQEFWVYMTKLLSDGNLWDFDIQNDGFGNTAFLLRSPSIKSGEEFALRDVFSEFIAKAVAALLGE